MSYTELDENQNLNLARLPIPPRGHFVWQPIKPPNGVNVDRQTNITGRAPSASQQFAAHAHFASQFNRRRRAAPYGTTWISKNPRGCDGTMALV